MEIRNWNEIIGKNGIRIEIEIFFQNGNNTGLHWINDTAAFDVNWKSNFWD